MKEFDFFDETDSELFQELEHMELVNFDPYSIRKNERIEEYEVFHPEEGHMFLHEAAIIAFKGRLFASWYSCPGTRELRGYTPIMERRSRDGGKTWSALTEVCGDKSEKLLFCPPVYHIEDDKLYMLINEMVAPDHIHAMDLYVLNEATDKFEFLWSKPIPFKLNTNILKMDNGKLLIPGRIAEPDGFPVTPAVLIADSGRINSDYRLVKIQENEYISEKVKHEHAECSAILEGEKVYMFCRDDLCRVPVLYISEDFAETWSKAIAHNIPFSNAKIYAGTLSDGRRYVIGNLYPERHKLAIFLTEGKDMVFTKGYMLQDGMSEILQYGQTHSYPSACEAEGKLYIIYSACTSARGAAMSVMPVDL